MTGRLHRCHAYNCQRLFINTSRSMSPWQIHCPKCGVQKTRVLAETVEATYLAKAFTVVTFDTLATATGTYVTFDKNLEKAVLSHRKDWLITALTNYGFEHDADFDKLNNVIKFTRKEDNGLAMFFFVKGRKTVDFILAIPKDDCLWSEVETAIKKDKKYRKENPLKAPKKYTTDSMKDALGADVQVGDWVCYWATKTLEFGKVKLISVENVETDYLKYEQQPVAKLVRGNQVIASLKSSKQIMLLPPEKAMILMLEK